MNNPDYKRNRLKQNDTTPLRLVVTVFLITYFVMLFLKILFF